MSEDRTPARSLGGRFTESTHPILERINRSVAIDQRLWAQDLRGSVAHAAMLAQVGLIDVAERDAIHRGLDAIRDAFEQGTFVFLDSDEDIHMAVERRLGELIGAPAAKLHTGRSRNDQVMLDTVLWMRDAATLLRVDLVTLVDTMLARAEQGLLVPMPSYTHAQPAQVSSVGQWMCAHASEIAGHIRRLDDFRDRLDACPLGAGASAGTYLPIDRDTTARMLGFARPTVNATATTGTRTDVLDALAVLAMIGSSLSRLGEEIVFYATPAYGFVQLPDRLTTGSSLLPQKRNPDGAELIRGQGKLIAGDFAAMTSAVSGLLSGYSKDLQADKTLLFRSWDSVVDLVALTTLHVDALTWNADRMRAACTPDLAALWLADRLVMAGLPFRTAHHLVGRAAREVAQGGVSLAQGLARAADDHEGEVPEREVIVAELDAMTPERLLGDLRTAGSAGPDSVRAQIGAIASAVNLRR